MKNNENLNYVSAFPCYGSKFRIAADIVKIIREDVPSDVNTFVDAMCGGGAVGAAAKGWFEKVFLFDRNKTLADTLSYLQKHTIILLEFCSGENFKQLERVIDNNSISDYLLKVLFSKSLNNLGHQYILKEEDEPYLKNNWFKSGYVSDSKAANHVLRRRQLIEDCAKYSVFSGCEINCMDAWDLVNQSSPASVFYFDANRYSMARTALSSLLVRLREKHPITPIYFSEERADFIKDLDTVEMGSWSYNINGMKKYEKLYKVM